MNSEEIDKLIAESLEQEKSRSRWHRSKSDRRHRMDSVRQVLNALFMLGFVAAVIIYFALPEQRLLFFGVGFGALIIKVIEFAIRFFA